MFSRAGANFRAARGFVNPTSAPRAAAAFGTGLALAALGGTVYASGDPNIPHYEWSHKGFMSGFDHASLRRGFEVYRQVCSSCHSLSFRAYRHLVGVVHTEDQAKAIARTVEVEDGPNDQGEMFKRPGKLFDHFPSPYPNDEFAAYINGGAIPPDLSLMVLARPNGEDYVFSLLTGYKPAPAGVQLRAGLNYNIYFPGNAISMAKPLTDGQVEWEDDTPATVTQMAKDVTTFLSWCAQPEHDNRKMVGTKLAASFVIAASLMGYLKRFYWNTLKNRRVTFVR